jgi:hypothetical protein
MCSCPDVAPDVAEVYWLAISTTSAATSRVVKNGSFVSILRVLTKRGGDDEKTGGVSTEIR